MPLIHSGTIIRRDAYYEVGGYDRETRYVIDNTMWLALCSAGKVAYVDKPFYGYRIHTTNMTNTERDVWRSASEWLRGVDRALARFSDDVLPDKKALRRRAYQYVLLSGPSHDIFAGRIRRGWQGYWQACRHHPMLTIFQYGTLPLVARTILGADLYQGLRQLRAHGGNTLEHVGNKA